MSEGKTDDLWMDILHIRYNVLWICIMDYGSCAVYDDI